MRFTENAASEPNGSLLRDDFVSQVREATDIEAVASMYGRVAHQKQRSLTQCPCQQRSADQVVQTLILNQHAQTAKCWLCLEQGDVFWLVMEHEEVCFRDAVRKLAAIAGIEEPDGVNWLASHKRRPHATTEPGSRRSLSSLQSFEAPRELRI